MHWSTAVILGIVEGLTEFLPVSSTGHLITAGSLLGFAGETAAGYTIAIQLGAILAVVVYYRHRLLAVITTFPNDATNRRLILVIICAFLPAAVVGLFTHSFIIVYLFSPKTVAGALIVGGIAILIIERMRTTFRVHDVSELQIRDAVIIGCAQCLALFPGISRSGSTIMGGVLLGLDRRTATEFSFFLAMPTMVAATGYQIVENPALIAQGNVLNLAIGLTVSFLTALAVIAAFLKYVTTNTFVPFAYYRIVFGLIVLYLFW